MASTPLRYSFDEAVADEVRFEVHRRSLTLEELSVTSGLSSTAIQEKLSGQDPFSVSEISALATPLGTTGSELIARAETTLAARLCTDQVMADADAAGVDTAEVEGTSTHDAGGAGASSPGEAMGDGVDDTGDDSPAPPGVLPYAPDSDRTAAEQLEAAQDGGSQHTDYTAAQDITAPADNTTCEPPERATVSSQALDEFIAHINRRLSEAGHRRSPVDRTEPY